MSRPRIVVVNDDPNFLDLIQDLVADTRNYSVDVIQQGMGAVDHLRNIRPDAILLDIRLEYARLGYHVLEAIRRDQGLQKTPIIVCTGDAEFLARYREHLKKLDCDWLEKPFLIDDLLKKIDKAINKTDDGDS